MVEHIVVSGAPRRSQAAPHIDEIVDHATLLLDDALRITAGSGTASQFFQLPISDMVGRPVTDFLPGLRAARPQEDRRYTPGQMARVRLSRVTLLARRNDGREIPVTVSLIETREEGGIQGVLRVRQLHDASA